MSHLKISVLVSAALAMTPLTAAADGTSQLGSSQALRSSTELFVDIVDSDVETISWTGSGTLEVRAPDGSVVGVLASGETAVLPAQTPGAYRVIMSNDQSVGNAWDIGVVGAVKSGGRLYSRNWYFNAGSFEESAATDGSFYALLPGGAPDTDAVIELKLDGLAGYVYEVNANRIGVNGDSGGRSVPGNGNSVTPEFPIYLDPPAIANYGWVDAAVYGLDFIGGTSVDVSGNAMDPCSELVPGTSTGLFQFQSGVEGSYHLECDLNGDGVYESNSGEDLLIVGTASVGLNTAAWDGTHNGANVATGDYQCRVRVNVGEFHYVGWDIETSYPGLRIFEVEADGTRNGLNMYWNDSLVFGNAVPMPNGDYGLETSGSLGVFSGNYAEAAIPNLNARSWGHFQGDGRGNVAFVDTYVWLDSDTSATIAVSAVDGTTDTDGDGLSDFEERCVVGSDPQDPDTDGDGENDGTQYGSSSSAGNGGLESNGKLLGALTRRAVKRSRSLFFGTRASFVETLSQKLPPVGPRDSVAVPASPDDLTQYTNAVAVHGANYVDASGRTIGGVLLLETVGTPYDHSKAICDRASGSSILEIGERKIDNIDAVGAVFIDRRRGSLDRAVTFKLYDKVDEQSTLRSEWLNSAYPDGDSDQRIINVQVWGRMPGDEIELARLLMEHLEVDANQPELVKAPRQFFSSGSTLGGTLDLDLRALESHGATEVRGTFVLVDGSTYTATYPVKGLANEKLSVKEELFRDVTVELLTDGETVDRMWLSDGAWAPLNDNHHGGQSEILSFSDSECRGMRGATTGTRLWGCGELRAKVDGRVAAARYLSRPIRTADASQVSFSLASSSAVSVCMTDIRRGEHECFDFPASAEPTRRTINLADTHLLEFGLLEFAMTEPGMQTLSVDALVLGGADTEGPGKLEKSEAGCQAAGNAQGWLLVFVLLSLLAMRRHAAIRGAGKAKV